MGELKQLRLNSLENSRKSLSRVIRAYYSGDVPENQYRALVYGLDKLLAYWKEESTEALEKRIKNI
jgi:hypothetical protein